MLMRCLWFVCAALLRLSSATHECPDGKYISKGNRDVTCEWCTEGRAQSREFDGDSPRDECDACPGGKYGPYGTGPSGDRRLCYTCGAGTYTTGLAYGFCPQCAAGKYSGRGASSCINCAAGKYSQSGKSECATCAAGTYSSGSQACASCAAGKFAPAAGTRECALCAAGTYSGGGATSCTSCAVGKFAQSAGTAECAVCAAGTFSGGGATSCTSCAAGKYSQSAGTEECAVCEAGTYSDGGATACTSCAAGTFAESAGTGECAPCAAGTYSDGDATACILCPAATFSTGGAASCTSCGDDADSRWSAFVTGTVSRVECRCEPAFTGEFCKLDGCSEILGGASLGGLLLEAAWPESTRDMGNAETTWNSIFRSADTNGDNYLTKTEALAAIATMHMAVPAADLPVWSRQRAGSFEFEVFLDGAVTITDMVSQLRRLRKTADLHQHGGGGRAGLVAVEATYPAADWDENKCTVNKDSGVNFAWSVNTTEKTLYRQCSYRNGVLHAAFVNQIASASASICQSDGKQTTTCEIRDEDGIGDTDDRKRLYCLEALFCPLGVPCDTAHVDETLMETRCSTGLVYDGAPADVVPALVSSIGVRFSWLDTSQTEEGFRIFRSPVDAPTKTTLIADIPIKSDRCGQPFSPISYYDRDVGDSPGTYVSYTVSTIDADGKPEFSSTTRFTSPWVAAMSTAVVTRSGAPVQDALVTVYHLDDDGSIDFKYAPLRAGLTDIFGDFVADLRVTDRSWTADTQHFLVNVSKTTVLQSGAVMEHDFAPKAEVVTLAHFRSAAIEFVDESAIAVAGVVRYDFAADDFDGPCLYADAKFQCYCPVRDTVVVVDRGGGEVENYPVDDEGRFAFAMNTDNGADVAYDGALSPSVTFLALADTDLEFVSADAVQVRVGVLGGRDGAAYANGQPVVFGMEGCAGFARRLYTYMGYASVALPPAPKFQLRLGQEGLPCAEVEPANILDEKFNTGVRGCRVEMPVFPASDPEKRPCSASAFKYVDDFFQSVGSERDVDLSTLPGNATQFDSLVEELYYFPAPFCVKEVKIIDAKPLKTGDARLRDLFQWKESPRPRPRTSPSTEAFLLEPTAIEEDGPEPYGKTCFTAAQLPAVYVEGDAFSLEFAVVERHPKADAFLWPWGFRVTGDSDSAAAALGTVAGLLLDGPDGPVFADFRSSMVESPPMADALIEIVVNDGISQAGLFEAQVYNSSVDYGFSHHLTAGDPNPFAPFSRAIFFEFSREVDGASLDFARHAIVLGVVTDDVPTIFAMATDPTLIFTVLRDPPGGDSFATLTEGTELSLSMSIAGMHAVAHDFERSESGSAGIGMQLGISVGIFVAAQKNTFTGKVGVGFEHTLKGPSVAASRAASQAHDMTFTFDVAISTSTDPYIAGQPSDVIVGGGANLRVLTAIEVDITRDAEDTYCVGGDRTYEWLPEQVSTFVMTVYEIEKTIERLGALHDDGGTDDSELALENWKTVLANYRKSTASSTESYQDGIRDMLRGFQANFEHFAAESDDGDNAFKAYLAKGLSYLSESDHASPYPVSGDAVDHVSAQAVRDSVRTVARFASESRENCRVGDVFGLGRLCDTPAALKFTGEVASKLLGVCDFGSQGAAVKAFCAEQGPENGPRRSAFDAFGAADRVITFSGTTAVEFEYTIGEAASRSAEVGFSTDSSNSYGLSQSACLDIMRRRLQVGAAATATATVATPAATPAANGPKLFSDKAPSFCRRLFEREDSEGRRRLGDSEGRRRLGVGLNLGSSQTWGSAFSVELSRSAGRVDAHSHAVSVTLADPNPYDLFAVRLAQDPVHGTPVFTTMGGQSSCPGETGTTKIDSRVSIFAVEYHCGADFEPRADCDDLPDGSTATIGVILQNLSPSLRGTIYRLDVVPQAKWDAGKYYGGETGFCGRAGDSSGLEIKINGVKPFAYMLDDLPYGQSEVFVTLRRTHPMCREFRDIEITLTSQCEYDADDVYQYAIGRSDETNEISVIHPQFDHNTGTWGLNANGEETAGLGPATSSASFSVGWKRTVSMTTPAPTTRFPTRAPTPAALSVSVSVYADLVGNETMSSYCATVKTLGLANSQAAVVEAYVLEAFNISPLGATANCVEGATAAEVGTVLELRLVAADVIDRAAGRTTAAFSQQLGSLFTSKVESGAWVADQLAYLSQANEFEAAQANGGPMPFPAVPDDHEHDSDADHAHGRRLAVDLAWAAKVLASATFSTQTIAAAGDTLAPSPAPTVPEPTAAPTTVPTAKPTAKPTGPTTGPTTAPTGPTFGPTFEPTAPTAGQTAPTGGPTLPQPTQAPSEPTGGGGGDEDDDDDGPLPWVNTKILLLVIISLQVAALLVPLVKHFQACDKPKRPWHRRGSAAVEPKIEPNRGVQSDASETDHTDDDAEKVALRKTKPLPPLRAPPPRDTAPGAPA
ncbi:hypothetical protein M885DRAFT_591847 [Pelagophyceae sp. CCMP2097]|nr:hypothetical protein M885DRAFT_591847 [Pelagophyceae sp. CCMP2097]